MKDALACEACKTPAPATELHLSPAGQWLCRSCFGTYQARVASGRARSAEPHRRCSCGAELLPMGESEVPAYHDGALNLGFFFQASVYRCAECSRTFKLLHPAMCWVTLGVVAFIFFGVARDQSQRGKMFEAVLFSSLFLIAALGPDTYRRWRHPVIH